MLTITIGDVDEFMDEFILPWLVYLVALPVYFGVIAIHAAVRSPTVHRCGLVALLWSWWLLCPASALTVLLSLIALVCAVIFMVFGQEVPRQEVIARPPSLFITRYSTIEVFGWCLLRRHVKNYHIEYRKMITALSN